MMKLVPLVVVMVLLAVLVANAAPELILILGAVPSNPQAGSTSEFVFSFAFGEELNGQDEATIRIIFPDEVSVTEIDPAPAVVVLENSGILGTVATAADLDYGALARWEGVPPSEVLHPNVYTITVPLNSIRTGETTWITFTEAAEIHQPMESKEYCISVDTSDEGWVDGEEANQNGCWMVTGQPVMLYLKRQIPELDCGYKQLDPVASFSTIQDALDAAWQIWNGEPLIQTDEMWPRWNLFEGCPSNIPDLGPETGVYVGAVIAVSADFAEPYGDPDVYYETLDVQVPGLILGSYPSGTVDMAVIDAYDYGGLENEPVAIDGTWAAVAIGYGGVTLGESSIGIMTDDFGVISETFDLNGFVIMDAMTGSHGVAVWPHEDKCDDVNVYDSKPVSTGWIDDAMYLEEDTVTLTVDMGDVVMYDKIVDLETGWSGYVIELAYIGQDSYGYDVYTATMQLTQPANDPVGAVDVIPVSDFFDDGDRFAGFEATGTYMCDDARVDIRGNEIFGMDWSGIFALSASVWVDSNFVHDNGESGFYGANLRPCDTLAVCDGGSEARAMSELLELSNNEFALNGAESDPYGDSGCWDPDAASDPPNAGIEIVSTVQCGMYLTESEFLFIHDNLIHENHEAGITLWPEAAVAGNRILWNDITANHVYGVWSGVETVMRDEGDFDEPTDNAEADVIFRYNDVTENVWGVYNAAWDNGTGPSIYFNAKENYWNACEENGGDDGPLADCPPGGPSRGPAPCAHMEDRRYGEEDMRPLGYGDAVDKGTFYNPWLTVEAFEFSDDFVCANNVKTFLDDLSYQHKRIYGSDSLILEAGWNTLAVPLSLRSDYQTLAELRTLGTFLEDGMGMKKYEIVYEYNNTGLGWLNLSEGDRFLPVHGYLIKMLEPTRFPVIYGDAFVAPPIYSLTADDPGTDQNGWNFIGAAFGIDREDDGDGDGADQGRWAVADPDDSWLNAEYEEEAWMWAGDYLAGLIDYTGNMGLTSLFNPWVTGQIKSDGFEDAPWLVWQPTDCMCDRNGCCPGPRLWTGQAYWTHMADARALRGMEQAPLFFPDDPPLPLR
jgi:hypothetical protein